MCIRDSLSIYNKNREITTSVGCGFRAIAACYKLHTHVPKKPDEDAPKIHTFTPQNLHKIGGQIAIRCGLTYEVPLKADDFAVIEETLGCRIFVFSKDENDKLEIVFKPHEQNRDLPLFVIGYDPEETHYYPFPGDSIKIALGSVEPENIKGPVFCHQCYSFTDHLINHLQNECTEYRCGQCLTYKCKASPGDTSTLLHCDDCNRDFYNAECLKLHEDLTCKYLNVCTLCDSEIVADKQGKHRHDCMHIKCGVCLSLIHISEPTRLLSISYA